MRMSSSSPANPISLLKKTGNKVNVRLSKFIEEKEEVDSITKKTQHFWIYETEDLLIIDRPGLSEYIAGNFDNFFEAAKKQAAAKAEKELKKEKMDRLIGEFEQLDINSKLKTEVSGALTAMPVLEEANKTLQSDAEFLNLQIIDIMEMLIANGVI